MIIITNHSKDNLDNEDESTNSVYQKNPVVSVEIIYWRNRHPSSLKKKEE